MLLSSKLSIAAFLTALLGVAVALTAIHTDSMRLSGVSIGIMLISLAIYSKSVVYACKGR